VPQRPAGSALGRAFREGSRCLMDSRKTASHRVDPVPVLLLSQALTQGGSERQLTEIAKALDRARFIPHVSVLRPGGVRLEELRNARVPVELFELRSFASTAALGAAWRLRRYLASRRIQLVHSFDTPMNVFATPVAWLARTPVVLTSQRAYRELSPPPFRSL